jgi:hypothetical protein
MSTTDSVDPKCIPPKIETALPKREKLLREIDDPKLAKLRIDNVDPKCT